MQAYTLGHIVADIDREASIAEDARTNMVGFFGKALLASGSMSIQAPKSKKTLPPQVKRASRRGPGTSSRTS